MGGWVLHGWMDIRGWLAKSLISPHYTIWHFSAMWLYWISRLHVFLIDFKDFKVSKFTKKLNCHLHDSKVLTAEKGSWVRISMCEFERLRLVILKRKCLVLLKRPLRYILLDRFNHSVIEWLSIQCCLFPVLREVEHEFSGSSLFASSTNSKTSPTFNYQGPKYYGSGQDSKNLNEYLRGFT